MPPKHADWWCSRCNFKVFGSKTQCKCGTLRPDLQQKQQQQHQAPPPPPQQQQHVAMPGTVGFAPPVSNDAPASLAPASSGLAKRFPRTADWNCGRCNIVVFGSKSQCSKCHAVNPHLIQMGLLDANGNEPQQQQQQQSFAVQPSTSGSNFQQNNNNNDVKKFPRTADWNCNRCSMTIFGSKSRCGKCNTPNPHLVQMGLLDANGNEIHGGGGGGGGAAAAPISKDASSSSFAAPAPAPAAAAAAAVASSSQQQQQSLPPGSHSTSSTCTGTGAVPPARCFKRSPDLSFADSVAALLTGFKAAPPSRPELANLVPDADDAKSVLKYVDYNLDYVKQKPAVAPLLQANGGPLTDDDCRVLIAFKLENPYAVYRWMNAFLYSTSRDDVAVTSNVGPFFSRLYRALEKLTATNLCITSKAARSAIVNNDALRTAFADYGQRFAPGSPLSFWGVASFSTNDAVINSPFFLGEPSQEAILYQCGSMRGILLDAFAPQGLAPEQELLALPPACFKVVASTMLGKKLIVTIEPDMARHCDVAYVVPQVEVEMPRGN